MTVQQFIDLLESHDQHLIRFILPSGDGIPDNFHITEVGRVEKYFIDCGGTRRKAFSCLLQVWVATDLLHRLKAGKLASILRLAAPLLKSLDLPIQIEFGISVAAQYFIAQCEVTADRLNFLLEGKQTDCLAKDKRGVGEYSTSGCCN